MTTGNTQRSRPERRQPIGGESCA
ncbi:hypothetical protein FRIGORI9N_470183 [Frigoribacterium sp. 9N]|nr:hypothetical protein FRIGORI9N_470183 [Frigoribacterium sp. 9N]